MPADNPLSNSGEPVTWNFKLLAQNDLGGFGGMGEGMSVQLAKDGRRIIWLAHESAPKNFTGVDVTDPRKPKVVVQTDLPQAFMRSNSLELSGDIMAVAYQTQKTGQKPAGLELFDVSVPEKPRSISFFDCSGRTFARRAPIVVLRRRVRAHGLRRARLQAEPSARRPVLPLHRRAQSVEAERGRPLVDAGHVARPTMSRRRRGTRSTKATARTTRTFTRNGRDRLYLCYIDGGMFVMDIKDKANPKVISHWTNSPPYTGFMHTAVPLFERNLMLVTDELTENAGQDWPKLIWILDMRDETHPVSISTCPLPPVDAYKDRGGRFGAHNIHENVALPTSWQSDQIVLGTFFNGGLRAYDISNPYQPKEVGAFVPPPPKGTPAGAVQLNDVFVDERGIVYTRRPPHRRAVHAGDGFLIVMAGRVPAISFREAPRPPDRGSPGLAPRAAR